MSANCRPMYCERKATCADRDCEGHPCHDEPLYEPTATQLFAGLCGIAAVVLIAAGSGWLLYRLARILYPHWPTLVAALG